MGHLSLSRNPFAPDERWPRKIKEWLIYKWPSKYENKNLQKIAKDVILLFDSLLNLDLYEVPGHFLMAFVHIR